MRENVTISYRGARYELGRGPGYYGIWPAGVAQEQPYEWWPETPEGWYGAWSRFTSIETPGSIVPVPQPDADPADAAAQADPAAQADAAGVAGPPGAGAAGAAGAAGQAAQAGSFGQQISFGQGSFGQGSFGQPGAGAQAGPATLAEPAIVSDSTAPVMPSAPAAGPGTRTGRRPTIAAGLLAVGVGCGIAGLFPGYLVGSSIAGQTENLVAHLIYLAAWTTSAVLILLGGGRQRAGALLGTGTSIVTFGLFLADAGTVIDGGTHLLGAGLVLSLLGWLGCAAGSVLALRLQPLGSLARAHDFETGPRYQQPAWPGGPAAGPWQAGQMWQGAPSGPAGARSRALTPVLILVAATLAGLGAAAAFAPPWDSFTLRTAAGATQTVTAGNAFANPAPVIAGDVIVMVALVAVVVVAALWRPVRLGAALLAGAIIPMAAQAISAVVQIGQKTSPLQFGIDPGQANQAGLTISNGLTAAFWIYLVFVLALIAICGWMLAPARKSAPAAAAPSPVGTFS